MTAPGKKRGLVVAGADGSESSLAAVELAAYEARLRGAVLRVVHIFDLPPSDVLAGHVLSGGQSTVVPPEQEAILREVGNHVADAAVDRARAVEHEVDATGMVARGNPTTILEEQSREADLLVVGSRGLGGFKGMLLGSTAVSLAARGRCPLLVVREPQQARRTTGADVGRDTHPPHGPDAGPVAVAVDGSPVGDRAVEFAFAEADLRGTNLLAVHAYTHWSASLPEPPDPRGAYAYEPGTLEENERRVLAAALSGHQERHPDVVVERWLVTGNTRDALVEASGTAQLMVVGARGRGGFTGLLLGSVSQAMLHHAECPVVVVRGSDEDR